MQRYYVHDNYSAKFQLKRIKESSTSFTKLQTGQKLEKDLVLNLGKEWLDVLMDLGFIRIRKTSQLILEFS